MRGPACRICRCVEHRACSIGCGWARVERGDEPLCTVCEEMLAKALAFLAVCPRKMARVVAHLFEAFEEDLEEMSAARARKCVRDLMARELVERVCGTFYQVTPRGRAYLRRLPRHLVESVPRGPFTRPTAPAQPKPATFATAGAA